MKKNHRGHDLSAQELYLKNQNIRNAHTRAFGEM